MTKLKTFIRAEVPADKMQALLQHIRDFDSANPDCNFEIAVDDDVEMPTAERRLLPEMTEWQPIETAPRDVQLLIACNGWLPVIAVRHGENWGECLGGEYYGTKPPFEPTHWKPLEKFRIAKINFGAGQEADEAGRGTALGEKGKGKWHEFRNLPASKRPLGKNGLLNALMWCAQSPSVSILGVCTA